MKYVVIKKYNKEEVYGLTWKNIQDTLLGENLK